ncbi:MAG: nucleotide sugar dehydrogenase [Thermoplasmata archaeon]|nr:MAG: nucleotide sugar dehydrogenase [Thermoplasmata archaeon]
MDRKIVVVGMGYVGIPVACAFAKKGFNVIGINRSKPKVDMINQGESPIKGKEPHLQELLAEQVSKKKLSATQNFSVCKDAYAILISVQTPFDTQKMEPNYSSLESALKDIGKNLSKGTLVVIESTIAPTTMDKIVKPILEEESGLTAGKDFYLANCPERVMPGRLLQNIKEYDRVVGGINEESANMAVELYSNIVEGELFPTDSLTAEIVKTAENAYRDVQIAFANEIAQICEKLGMNAYEVKDLVNKCPFRDMHIPGAGVGGHCLPKDSWLLAYGVKNKLSPKLIALARNINDFMPHHMVELTESALSEAQLKMQDAVISILGVAYLADSDDTRNSPAQTIINELKNKGAKIRAHDPFVKDFEDVEMSDNLDEALASSDCLVLVTAHSAYQNLKLDHIKKLMRNPIIVDGRNMFDKDECIKMGFVYFGIGK